MSISPFQYDLRVSCPHSLFPVVATATLLTSNFRLRLRFAASSSPLCSILTLETAVDLACRNITLYPLHAQLPHRQSIREIAPEPSLTSCPRQVLLARLVGFDGPLGTGRHHRHFSHPCSKHDSAEHVLLHPATISDHTYSRTGCGARATHKDACASSTRAAAARTCSAQCPVASARSSQNVLPTPNALDTCGSSTSGRYTPFPARSSVESSASSFGSRSTSPATKVIPRAAVAGGQCSAADSRRFAKAAARQDGGATDAERGGNASSSARKRVSAGDWGGAEVLRTPFSAKTRTGVGATSMSG